MSSIKQWQEKIKERRRNTDFRDFLKEITSWFPLNFYKNNGNISRYPEKKRFTNIVSSKEFEKNRSDLNNCEYNLKNSFFVNYKNLLLNFSFGSIIDYGGNENADFADMVVNSKSIYISFAVISNCENVLYGVSVKDNSKDIISGLSVWDSSNIVYQSTGIIQSYKIFYSKYINNSSNIWFSSNLTGCKECLFCNKLDNKSYNINNKQYSKEEYFLEKENILKQKENFLQFYKNINKPGDNISSNNVNGNYIVNSSNINSGYFCSNVKKGQNIILVGGAEGDEDMYDVLAGGSPTANNFYGVMGANGENLYCCTSIITSSNIFYSSLLEHCSFCLGCIGLKNKSYCILNKQYTKHEWEILADKIFASMEEEGTLGDFFPGELNPFYFNDTMAGLLGNFTKEEVEKEGYMWRDEEIKVDIPEDAEVISAVGNAGMHSLQDFQGFDGEGNWRINPEILKKVIVDEQGNYYKIVKMEYDFLIKHGLPLPELHWLDRMKLNLGV